MRDEQRLNGEHFNALRQLLESNKDIVRSRAGHKILDDTEKKKKTVLDCTINTKQKLLKTCI